MTLLCTDSILIHTCDKELTCIDDAIACNCTRKTKGYGPDVKPTRILLKQAHLLSLFR